MKRCQRCFEPVSPTCLRCVDIPKEPTPAWTTIILAYLAGGLVIYSTWNGSLFG